MVLRDHTILMTYWLLFLRSACRRGSDGSSGRGLQSKLDPLGSIGRQSLSGQGGLARLLEVADLGDKDYARIRGADLS